MVRSLRGAPTDGGGRQTPDLRSLPRAAWPLIQGAAAATIAWLIATRLPGHPAPFFAAIAAFIGLNASFGQRGRNALRLLLGVMVGILTGEVALGILGPGAVALAIATLGSTTIARVLGGSRVAIGQAASSAILTVATGEHIGADRMIDALIGTAVALSFSQVLFSPDPFGPLRRAQARVLDDIARQVRVTARALDTDDHELGAEAIGRLRGVYDRLAELGETRAASTRSASHSAVWRAHMTPLVRESDNASHLDLLAGSCLMLVRMTLVTARDERHRVAPAIGDLAGILEDLAARPWDRATRQDAADRAMDIARSLDIAGVTIGSQLTAAIVSLQIALADVLIFAGADPLEADAAVRAGTGSLRVPEPPGPPARPFSGVARWPLSLPGVAASWLRRRLGGP